MTPTTNTDASPAKLIIRDLGQLFLRHRRAVGLLFSSVAIVGGMSSAIAQNITSGDPGLRGSTSEITYYFPQYSWQPVPEQETVEEGLLDVGGATLWYWDTGGNGEVIVFSHSASGSGLSWEYQQPFLVNEGYRVIGYSRRGRYQSEVYDQNIESSATTDLLKLVDHLGIDKFHIVAIAAGAGVAPDFATQYPGRLLSLMIGCTTARTSDRAVGMSDLTLRPSDFNALPTLLREVSPFYRSANPEGAAAWLDKSERSRGAVQVGANLNQMTPELLASIDVPVLLFTGDADLYMPPSRLRAYSKYWTDPKLVVFRGAAHAPYWEQPLAFNEMIVNFIQNIGN